MPDSNSETIIPRTTAAPHEHADGFDIDIPPVVFKGAILVMAIAVVGFLGWSVYRDIKNDAQMSQRFSNLTEKIGKQELMVAIAPMVPDDSSEV